MLIFHLKILPSGEEMRFLETTDVERVEPPLAAALRAA